MLNLNRKTVMKWKEEGDWHHKQQEYLKSKQNPYNIVIIDDSRYDLYEHFFPEHIIHIDNFRRSLDYKHVEQFINPYNLNSDNENSK